MRAMKAEEALGKRFRVVRVPSDACPGCDVDRLWLGRIGECRDCDPESTTPVLLHFVCPDCYAINEFGCAWRELELAPTDGEEAGK